MNFTLPPLTLDVSALRAASDALKYFVLLCRRPIACDEYEIARDAAINIYSTQVVDNNDSDLFIVGPNMAIRMDYELQRMGEESTFEMVANLELKQGDDYVAFRITHMKDMPNDLLQIVASNMAFVVHIPGINRAASQIRFQSRIGGIGVVSK